MACIDLVADVAEKHRYSPESIASSLTQHTIKTDPCIEQLVGMEVLKEAMENMSAWRKMQEKQNKLDTADRVQFFQQYKQIEKEAMDNMSMEEMEEAELIRERERWEHQSCFGDDQSALDVLMHAMGELKPKVS